MLYHSKRSVVSNYSLLTHHSPASQMISRSSRLPLYCLAGGREGDGPSSHVSYCTLTYICPWRWLVEVSHHVPVRFRHGGNYWHLECFRILFFPWETPLTFCSRKCGVLTEYSLEPGGGLYAVILHVCIHVCYHWGVLGFQTVYFVRGVPTFRGNLLPPQDSVFLKRCYPPTKLRGVTFYKTAM